MMTNEEDDELAFLSEDDELDKKLIDPGISLTPYDHVIVVSYRLPIQIVREKAGDETKLVTRDSGSHLYP